VERARLPEADSLKREFNITLSLGWGGSCTTWDHLSKPLSSALERNKALVQKWVKQEYPRIKTFARREKAEIYFGDAAHVRSDQPHMG
jgi:hypothetical protein